jgi:hypothetical protein
MESAIRLLLADVDGTLVTPDKVLTERAVQAVHRLGEVGILFAITSGRPPRGMLMSSSRSTSSRPSPRSTAACWRTGTCR